MAINKKLIHFSSKSVFDEKLANNEILDTSIVFIQDTQQIWTHGQLYSCLDSNIQAVDTGNVLDDVDITTYIKYVEQSLSEEQKTQARNNIGAVSQTSLSEIAMNIDYNNLLNKPGIPKSLSQLDNDIDFISSNNLKTINGETLIGTGNILTGSSTTPVVYHEPSETSLELVPGVLHKWSAESPLTSLSFTLPDDAEDSVNNYKLVFTIGSGFTISLPSYLKWENNTIPEFEEGMRCEMNIEDERIVCAIFPLPNIETANLEYVENDGVDFVRTDILVPEDCDGFRCKVALLNDNDPTEYVFGTTSSDGDFLGAYVNTMDYTLHTVYNTIDEEHADVSLGVAYEVMTTDHGGTSPSEDPLYVFTYNAGAVPATVSKLRFYYLRMYDAMGETLVNLIPARSGSGVIGLKDEVSGTFYPSENGNLIGG